MSVLIDFSIVPIGKGDSVSPYVARVTKIIRASGLPSRLHAMGTEVEADHFDPLATLLAIVLVLVVADVPADMIWKPFTVMPFTTELPLPPNDTREVGSGGEVVTTGVTPAAAAGPLIVTVLPEALAL